MGLYEKYKLNKFNIKDDFGINRTGFLKLIVSAEDRYLLKKSESDKDFKKSESDLDFEQP